MNLRKSNKIKAGTRPSPLALAQLREVFALLAERGRALEYDSVPYQTRGDQDKTTPLTTNPADDFFTDALDQALLNREIDIAVHSAKDLPKIIQKGLKIFALTSALDETDAFVGRTSFKELPTGAKIGTSSLLRQESLKKLNPSLVPCEIRGTIQERIALVDNGTIDGVLVATCALKRLGLDDKIKDIMPWEATPLQGQLAVVGRSDDRDLAEIFSAVDVRRGYGPVTLVGAGPGDPELITVKAIRALESADCVFYDYLVDKSLLNYAPAAEKIYVGKRKGEHSLAQSELSKMLKDKALSGKNVVRLKGGDPLVFGRGADEIGYLQSYYIDVRIIPGISSATGIPALLGIPLTARGISSSVAFVSGHAGEEKDPQALLEIPKADTLIFLMGLTKLGIIVRSLTAAGWKAATPVIVISKGTRPDEKIVDGTLENIEERAVKAALGPPALIVAGEVVRFWKETAAHSREKILYLGTHPEKYRLLGNIVHVPMIRISAIEMSPEQVQDVIRSLPGYDMLIFTSRFAARFFIEALRSGGYPLSKLIDMEIAAIGRETAGVLEDHGIKPDIVAGEETGEGLFKTICSQCDLKGKKILFPRSELPNPFLKDNLSALGAQVTELPVYRNTPGGHQDFPAEAIGKIIFTSPSTVRNFLKLYGLIPAHWKILSKGPRTSEALKAAGYESEVLIYD